MFQKNNLKIINADCMDIMKDYEDNYFDLAIVDPPYGIGISGQKKTILKNPKHNRKFHKNKNWDNEIPNKNYFNDLFRVSKNQIIWGGNYFGDFLGKTRGIICWDKKQPWENFSGFELAWTSFDCVARIFRYSTTAVRNKVHPTQKPIDLYKWILDKYANQGDKILDTHLGSGASALAADEFKFKFSGYEINEDYFNNAVKRLEEQQKQKTFL